MPVGATAANIVAESLLDRVDFRQNKHDLGILLHTYLAANIHTGVLRPLLSLLWSSSPYLVLFVVLSPERSLKERFERSRTPCQQTLAWVRIELLSQEGKQGLEAGTIAGSDAIVSPRVYTH